jgi:hypothetical protein
MPTSTQLTIYAKFYSIDTWRDVVSLASIEPHLWKVYQDSSWEGGAPAILDPIPADDEIKELYDIYTSRPVAAPAPSDSSTDSLFGPDEYG